MRSGTVDTPSAIAARDSANRALTKPAKSRFTRELLRSTKNLPVYSPAGIYLGHKMSYDVDLHRLGRVVERTTSGLYFHEFGERLPDSHGCKSYGIDGFGSAGPQTTAEVKKFWEHAVSGTRHDFGENVFTYWVREIDGADGATLWAFLIYGTVSFLAITGPRDASSIFGSNPG